MELKLNPNGKVAFTMKTGKDTVSGEMLSGEAQELIRKGKVERKNGTIIVDDKFIFTVAGKEEPVEEPKKDVPLKEAVKKTSKKKIVDDADKKPLSDKPLSRKKKK